MKWGDVKVRVRGNLTAVLWDNEWNVYMLTNVHQYPAESNCCSERGNSLKPALAQVCADTWAMCRQIWLHDKHFIRRRIWKCTCMKNSLLHLLDLSVMNHCLPHLL
jgi:hypothetical protein